MSTHKKVSADSLIALKFPQEDYHNMSTRKLNTNDALLKCSHPLSGNETAVYLMIKKLGYS